MPVPQAGYGAGMSAPPPVTVGRKPKKKDEEQPPPTPQTAARTEQLNSQFGRTAPAAVTMPQEFQSALPDPAVVGLTDKPEASAATTQPDPSQDQSRFTDNYQPTYPAPTPPVSSDITGAPPIKIDRPYRPNVYNSPQEAAAATAQANERPVDRDAREALEALRAANAEQPKKRHGVKGRLLSALESFVIGAGQPFQQHVPRDMQELVYGLSRGAATSAYGAVKSDYPSRVRIESKRRLAGEQADEALKRQSEDANNRLRAANAEYAAGKGLREDQKIALKAKFDQARLAVQGRGLDVRQQNNLAIQALRREGLINDDEELELRRTVSQQQNEDRDLDRKQREDHFTRKFDADERQRKIANRIAERRASAYETAVQKGGGASELSKAKAAAEADVYDESASEIEQDIQELQDATPTDERGSSFRTQMSSLQRQLRETRLKGDKARAGAGQQTKASVTREQLKAITDEAEVRRIATENGKNADAYVKLWKEIRGQK